MGHEEYTEFGNNAKVCRAIGKPLGMDVPISENQF